ncbi:hypothetical protein [Microvirga arabica]|jgi:hypothetical protein|nr:hypothetical protein [Microvirga arabica]
MRVVRSLNGLSALGNEGQYPWNNLCSTGRLEADNVAWHGLRAT